MRFKEWLFSISILVTVIQCLRFVQATDDYSELVIAHKNEKRSRIIMIDGNMYFHAGKEKNITFRIGDGGAIMFGKTNILSLPNSTEIAKVHSLLHGNTEELDSVKENLRVFMDSAETTKSGFQTRLSKIEESIKTLSKKDNRRLTSKIHKVLKRIVQDVQSLVKSVKVDSCLEQPCQNGGTCIDLIEKYQCICPDYFEGKSCETRVDECAQYAGTLLGCQNNATCTNHDKIRGFTCHCGDGFHGVRCETRKASCSLDLCGEHGHCIESSDGYDCICHVGFKKSLDPVNPVCLDIDECAENPCYPGAGCVNTPGGFKCTSCPPGLIGNGIHCADFDECAHDFSNDCSKDPKVRCINTHGGYLCDSCPLGYKGDGVTCTKASPCDDKPCHELATCKDQPALECVCPFGYEGDGLGPIGCQPINVTSCTNETCSNGGTCIQTDEGNVRCRCRIGYDGLRCENSLACTPERCNGHGRCIGFGLCFCDPGFHGRRCELLSEGCDFYTNNETGIIDYNSMISIENQSKRCAWTIQLMDSRKVIEIKFIDVNISHVMVTLRGGCKYSISNLTVYDGAAEDAMMIGDFCYGYNIAPNNSTPFYTSGNAAHLVFTTRSHKLINSLKIAWQAVNPRCGRRLTSNEGSISYYDVHNEDACAWYISVPPQYHIELTLESIKMGTGTSVNCSVNSLTIFDHQTAVNRTQILTACESQIEKQVLRTTTRYATIYFKINRLEADEQSGVVDCSRDSDNKWCGVGFTLNYRVLELPTGCGGTITPDANGVMSGIIESPNYGYRYLPNLSCNWILNASIESDSASPVAEEARKVRIEFLDFDIATTEASLGRRYRINNCQGDYLRIMPRGGLFCNILPPRGIFSNSYFDIKFVTDAILSGRGFKLKYENICELDFDDANGTIITPNFPHGSKVPFKCTYRIHATPKQAIRIKFREIELTSSVSECFYQQKQSNSTDYIELQGGHKSNVHINHRYYCSRYPLIAPYGEVVTSGITPFHITYSTSGNTEDNKGFVFDYEVYDVGCGGIYTSQTGIITSPNYPKKYEAHMYCVYLIMVDADSRIRLDFDIFDVENVAKEEGCGYDSVRIFDGGYTDDDDHAPAIGTFCGVTKPPSISSTGNTMAIVFMSDRSIHGAGFSANYRAVNAADECDRTIIESEGTVEFNGTQFPRASKCDYVIMLPTNHRMLVKIENMTMPCNGGHLLLRNGRLLTSPAFPGHDIIQPCDKHVPRQFTTQGNAIFISLSTSDPTATYIRIKFEQYASGCGGHVTGLSGFISAPQYPIKDSMSRNCLWTVSVAEGNRVRLTFPFIDIQNSDIGGFCDSHATNKIDIVDASGDVPSLLKRFCIQQISTTPITASGNKITVRYVQQGGSYYGGHFGFLGYFSTDCSNIVLTDFQGTIQSPGYPGQLSPAESTSCKWTIISSPGTRIRILFHKFQLNDDDLAFECPSFIRLNKNEIENYTLSRTDIEPRSRNFKFCRDYSIVDLMSKENKLSIGYTSQRAAPNNGFYLSYETIGCGGVIRTNNTELLILTDDFANLDMDRECQYTITAPPGHVVLLSIEYGHFLGRPDSSHECEVSSRYQLAADSGADDASFDGIKFFPDASLTSVPNKILCGLMRNFNYTSYTNKLTAFLRFRKDNHMKNQDDNGIFKARVQFIKFGVQVPDKMDQATCGGEITVNSTNPISLMSPNFPKMYPPGTVCAWNVTARPGYLLEITVKKLAMAFKGLYIVESLDENCTASQMFISGGLSIYEPDSMELIRSLCVPITQPFVIDPNNQKATIVFVGSSREPVTSSSDEEVVLPGLSMTITIKCGGKLTATNEVQSFILKPLDTACSFFFTRNPDADGDKLFLKTEYLPIEEFATATSGTATFDLECGNFSPNNSKALNTGTDLSMDFSTCDSDVIKLITNPGRDAGQYLITYGLETQFCGSANFDQPRIVDVRIHDKSKPLDCEWTFSTKHGSKVLLSVSGLNMPKYEDCMDSFIEVRNGSDHGSPVHRFCGSNNIPSFEYETAYVRLRYRPSTVENDNNNDEYNEYLEDTFDGDQNFGVNIQARFEIQEHPKPGIIELPPPSILREKSSITWNLETSSEGNRIVIIVEELDLRGENVLSFTPDECADEDCIVHLRNRVISTDDAEQERTYAFDQNKVKVLYKNIGDNYYFRIRWKEVSPNEYRKITANTTTASPEDWTCGEDIFPTSETQSLSSPSGSDGKYMNLMRCKYTFHKVYFSNLKIRITKLDLEPHPSCLFDYVAFSVGELYPSEVISQSWIKICSMTSLPTPPAYTFHQPMFMYFLTDRSRTNTGFTLDYELGCNAVEYYTDEGTPFDHNLTSPGWPRAQRSNMTCLWGLVLRSTRQIKVTIDIDMEGSPGFCGESYLYMFNPLTPTEINAPHRCGKTKLEEIYDGKVYIKYQTGLNPSGRGFNIRFEEMVVDCSAPNLWVDATTPSKHFFSPEFPQRVPNSIDCQWTIHTMPGHSVKLTVDPHTFDLQNSPQDDCSDEYDYLEIRDGPSERSPLIGRYCGSSAPNTIVSSGTSLFVHLVTDSMIQSGGFNATYEVASCGGSIVLREAQVSSIQSTDFPYPYPRVEQCQWTVKAPARHFVESQIKHMNVNHSPNCTEDFLAIRDGNATGEYIMPPTCERILTPEDKLQSQEDFVTVQFQANSTNKMQLIYCTLQKCGFDLEVSASEYQCGGDIDDERGEITLPGYPDRFIKHLKCIWNFDAGMGYRYFIKFLFDNGENGFYLKSGKNQCFPDIEIFNGPMIARSNLRQQYKQFCSNKTTFLSTADLATVIYSDLSQIQSPWKIVDETKLQKPWKMVYQKVSAIKANESCSEVVRKNVRVRVGNLTIERGNTDFAIGARSFCHIRVIRPFEMGTTLLSFYEIRSTRFLKTCGGGNRIIIKDMNPEPWSINEVVCNATSSNNTTDLILPNQVIDILMVNNPHDPYLNPALEFWLKINFYTCGGHYGPSADQTGEIVSPHFDEGQYYKNEHCLWYFEAPEGMIVKLNATFMDVEYNVECAFDKLSIAEGKGMHSILHTFCNNEANPIPERFRVLRSRGRELTMLWKTNNAVELKGWKLIYEFVHYSEKGGCGFTSKAMAGSIESPNYPKDYPNMANCTWDLMVPLGYHIAINFEFFDVEAAHSGMTCDHDYVLISQELHSRALAPLGDYYFYFEHEERSKPLCGYSLPPPFVAESNRARVYFSSNAEMTAKGFRMKWKAVCGSKMELSHGVISSPFYPDHYPNDDMVCEWFIYPTLPNDAVPIITLKVLDFQLSRSHTAIPAAVPGSALTSFDQTEDCPSDHLEIFDLNHKKRVLLLCGSKTQNADNIAPISVYGPIGVKFVTNSTFMEGPNKMYRGFRISYALAECGGTINLLDSGERQSGIVSSPGYPLTYHNNLNCVWNITAPPGRIISGKFIAMDIESSSGCYFDYVTIYDGIQQPRIGNKTLGSYCGTDAPKHSFFTTENNMTVHFYSDHGIAKSGFRLVLTTTLGADAGCGGRIEATEQWQTLKPPTDANGKYFNGLRCLWNFITSGTNKQIEFKLLTANIETRKRVRPNNLSTCFDFLAIYDGPRTISPYLLPPTCNFKDFPLSYRSSDGSADVYFETDLADGFTGFQLDYRATENECGGTYPAKAESTELSFEGEGGRTRIDLQHIRCRMHFYSAEGTPLSIEFLQFNFPSTDSTCPFEFLEIRDVGVPAECRHPACGKPDARPPVVRFCGSILPPKYISTTAVVQMTVSYLKTSEYTSKFVVAYQTLGDCNRTINLTKSMAKSGQIMSPNYPNSYDINATCITKFVTSSDARLLLVFSDFDIEHGYFAPMRRSFGLRYGSRHILDDNSPPFRYGSRWQFRRPFITSDHGCKHDKVVINENPDDVNATKAEYCGTNLPPPKASVENTMEISFVSDGSIVRGGYAASYYSFTTGSTQFQGSQYTQYTFEPMYEKTGVISPIGYPKQYPNNTIQKFSIRLPSALFCRIRYEVLRLVPDREVNGCVDTPVKASDDRLLMISWPIDNPPDEDTAYYRLPCYINPSLPESSQPKTQGVNYDFLFIANGNSETNGDGFRITWKCDDFSEDAA